MSAGYTQADPFLDLDSASRILRRANAYVLANLAPLVDLAKLREGDFEDDYFVEVPCSRLVEVGDKLAELTCVAIERFDVGLGLMWTTG